MNKEVNFEIAKLLKENGFEGTKSPLWYYKDGTLHETPTVGYEGLKCWNTWDATQGVRWDAPTIAEVVMWLYEKHGIWISVTLNQKMDRFTSNIFKNYSYVCSIDGLTDERPEYGWDNPTEAYEFAIKHTLENKAQGGNNEQQ